MQETTTVATELSSFLTQLKGGLSDFSTTNLVTILIAGVGIAVAPAVAWFAYGFVKSKAVKAFKKGKI